MSNRRLIDLELPYLSKQTIDTALELHVEQGVDLEVAIEMAIIMVGEDKAFELPEEGDVK